MDVAQLEVKQENQQSILSAKLQSPFNQRKSNIVLNNRPIVTSTTGGLTGVGTGLSNSTTQIVSSTTSTSGSLIVGGSRAPSSVRIATLSSEQLQTMAKSSGLSVVHVTLPQVSTQPIIIMHMHLRK